MPLDHDIASISKALILRTEAIWGEQKVKIGTFYDSKLGHTNHM